MRSYVVIKKMHVIGSVSLVSYYSYALGGEKHRVSGYPCLRLVGPAKPAVYHYTAAIRLLRLLALLGLYWDMAVYYARIALVKPKMIEDFECEILIVTIFIVGVLRLLMR